MGMTQNTAALSNQGDALASLGLNRLEQVVLNMPEVRFYFAGDRPQEGSNLRARAGDQELTLQSLTPFAETGQGIHYYILLDISASISSQRFHQVTAGLGDFCQSTRSLDRITFLTFGEDVQLLFQEESSQSEAVADTIRQMKNPDQRTWLFEAVNRMAELSQAAQDHGRSVAFVITDGDDISTGTATREEALQTLQAAGIPVYGFTVEEAKRSSINAFGEFSRATGGKLTVLEQGAEGEGFQAIQAELLGCYEAVFTADSNLVSNTMVIASLEFAEEGERRQQEAMQSNWIPDTVSPVIEEVVQEGPRQLRVIFSEPVDGLEAAGNYRLTKQDAQQGEAGLVPAYASPGSGNTSVVLTFSDDLAGGGYDLSCSDICDHSMERNALSESISVTVDAEARTAETAGFLQGYGWLMSLAGVAILALTMIFAWRKVKKRKALVIVEDKAVLKSNTEIRYHVDMESGKLSEKQVYFHVAGQREALPVVIQGSMIVGRASTCELIFDDPALSRQHFALELRGEAVLLRNLSQSGFTTINGVRLGAEAYPLKPGDQIGAGQLKLDIRW